jgi:hypothetical protein
MSHAWVNPPSQVKHATKRASSVGSVCMDLSGGIQKLLLVIAKQEETILGN